MAKCHKVYAECLTPNCLNQGNVELVEVHYAPPKLVRRLEDGEEPETLVFGPYYCVDCEAQVKVTYERTDC